MVKNVVIGKNGRINFWIGLLIVIVAVVVMAIFFIFFPENLKQKLDDLGGESNELDSELGTQKPDVEVDEIKVDRSGGAVFGGGGSGGGSGGVSGGGAATETTNSANGALSISNRLDSTYQSSSFGLIHRLGGSEDFGEHDKKYTLLFDPNGKSSKINSVVENNDLKYDARPIDSMSTVNLDLSLVTSSGNPMTIESTNELVIEFPLENEGYDFGSKTITITVDGVEYDARTTSSIILANVSGTYNSGEVYNTITVSFA